jgi:hypothetical protein
MDSILIYNIQTGPIWDWRVVMDLFCGGVGVGASLLAVAMSGSEDSHRRRLGQTAAFLGPRWPSTWPLHQSCGGVFCSSPHWFFSG